MFSIVIPYYNIGNLIYRTLESLSCQTLKLFEVVIVDDGSTIPLSLDSSKYSFDLKIVRTPNQGVSVARNTGASISKYDWLVFLDAGDFYKDNFLLKMREAINSNPNYAVYASAFSFYQIEKEYVANTDLVVYLKIFNYQDYLLHMCNAKYLFHICSITFSKSLFFDIGGFSPTSTHGEDHELILKALRLVNKFIFINEPLFCYCLDDTNSVTRSNKYQPCYAHSNYLLSIEMRIALENRYLVYTLVDNFIVNIKKGYTVKAVKSILSFLPFSLYVEFLKVFIKRVLLYANK
ncbi:glycosyltransferase family 2 protein [Shewanella xiamenensis]|uniref:glycosyltransferase family 2 protein n=1 Tax=Shewanella xiamenensis TaxID=332186 RepID=UPI001C4E0726